MLEGDPRYTPPPNVVQPPSGGELRAWARTVDIDWLFPRLKAAGMKGGRIKLGHFLSGKRSATHFLYEALRKVWEQAR